MKRLEEMSLVELWQLFPIIIKPYDGQYAGWYKEEKLNIIKSVGGKNIIRIDHIGSTSVPGLAAKPTVDMLLQITEDCAMERLKLNLAKIEYIFSAQPKKPAPHAMFNKGYTQNGFAEKVFHLHIRYKGNWPELYFCSYLRKHPEICREYEKLKYRLAVEYKNDRDKYTDKKTEFIKVYTEKAFLEIKRI